MPDPVETLAEKIRARERKADPVASLAEKIKAREAAAPPPSLDEFIRSDDYKRMAGGVAEDAPEEPGRPWMDLGLLPTPPPPRKEPDPPNDLGHLIAGIVSSPLDLADRVVGAFTGTVARAGQKAKEGIAAFNRATGLRIPESEPTPEEDIRMASERPISTAAEEIRRALGGTGPSFNEARDRAMAQATPSQRAVAEGVKFVPNTLGDLIALTSAAGATSGAIRSALPRAASLAGRSAAAESAISTAGFAAGSNVAGRFEDPAGSTAGAVVAATALSGLAPVFSRVEKMIGGRIGTAVKGGLENLALLASPHVDADSGDVAFRAPSGRDATLSTLVMAAFAGARGKGLSDDFRQILQKKGVPPEVVDRLEIPLRDALAEASKASDVVARPTEAVARTEAAGIEVAPRAPEPRPAEVAPVEPARKTVHEAEPPAPVEAAKPPPVEPPPAPKVEAAKPEAAPEAPYTGDPFTTSLKRRIVDAEREARGLEPNERGPVRTHEGLKDEALKRIADDPTYPRALLEELRTSNRVPTDSEYAVLTAHRVNLRKALETADAEGQAAFKEGREADRIAAAERAQLREVELAESEAIVGRGKTRSGQSLAALRMEMAQDHSLQAMTATRLRDNGYKPLTESQAAEVKAIHDRLAKAEAERDALAARVKDIESRRDIGEVLRPRARHAPGEYGKSNKVVTREAYEAAKAAFRSTTQVNVGIDPAKIAALVKMGAYHVEAGARSLASWAKALTADLTPEERAAVAPHLRAVYAASLKEVKDSVVKDVSAEIAKGREAGKTIAEMPESVGKIAELLVRTGVKDRDALIDGVHEILKTVDPAVTRRQAMDAISGYGTTKALDKDPDKVALRELKGQMLQVAKLEDMAAGKAPLKTGVERQSPQDAQRELIRLVNDAKKKGNFNHPDPATELKSWLETTKTRLRNENADLERQIKARVKDIPNKAEAPSDPEVVALRARKAALREEFDAIFGKPGMTPQQRVEAAIKAGEKSIAELERRIATGDVFPGAREVKTPGDPRLTAIREKQKALRQQVADMKAAATPRRSDSEILLRSLERRAQALEKRIAAKDFATKERTPRYIPPEAVKAEARVQSALKEWRELRFREKMRNQTLKQKAARVALEGLGLQRAVMTSIDVGAIFRQLWTHTIGHPLQAAKAIRSGLAAIGNPLRGLEAGRLGREAQARAEAEIAMDPAFRDAKHAGVAFTEHGAVEFGRMEETNQSRIAEKIPLVAGSQRFHAVVPNKARLALWKSLTTSLSRNGPPTPTEAKAIAEFVNTWTGRGITSQRAANALAFLNNAFFSPQLWASRLKILTGQPLWGGTMRTRWLFAKEYARVLPGIALIYGIANELGADVETDPRSSDFAKIRMGNTRIDPLGGLSQHITFGARSITGEKKQADGKVVALRGDEKPPRGDDWFDTLAEYARKKAAPVPGAVMDLLTGRDVVGNKSTVGGEAAELLIPMSLRDLAKSVEAQGVPKGLALWIVSMLGMSVQNHEKRGGKR